jgi:predicted CopG family antitoxin
MRRISGQLNDGKANRPSMSEMVVELLTKHRAELDAME